MTKEDLIALYKKEVSKRTVGQLPIYNSNFQVESFDVFTDEKNQIRVYKMTLPYYGYYIIYFDKNKNKLHEVELTQLEYQELKHLLFLKPTQKTNMKKENKHPKLEKFLDLILLPTIFLAIFISVIGMIWFYKIKTEHFIVFLKLFSSSIFTFLFTVLIYAIFCYDSKLQKGEEEDNVGIK